MTSRRHAAPRRAAALLTVSAALLGLIASSAAGATYYNNGGVVNQAGANPDGPGLSMVTGSDLTAGFGAQQSANNRVADDFVVTDVGGWTLQGFEFFTYQTGSSTTSTITAATVRVWNGPPDLTPTDTGSTVVFGDTTTNRLVSSVFTNSYRVSAATMTDTSRPIMRTTVAAPVTLAIGTYWVDVQFAGSLASGPWVVPVTLASDPATGNALRSLNGAAWAAMADEGSGVQKRLAFKALGAADTAISAATVSGASASFTYAGDPATIVTAFECRLDGGAYAACPGGTKQYTGLSAGSHTFEVRSLIGPEADATPATRTVTVVDTTAPKLGLTGRATQKAGKKVKGAATCDEACTVSVKGKVTARSPSGTTATKLAGVQVKVSAGGKTTVKLVLTAKARAAAQAALAAGGTATVKLTGVATDASGNKTTKVTFTVKLT